MQVAIIFSEGKRLTGLSWDHGPEVPVVAQADELDKLDKAQQGKVFK